MPFIGPLMRFPCAAFALAISASCAFAQRAPIIVVPGRPDVSVYINGIDATWGIVEGEFGLDRPNMVTQTVVWRPYPPTIAFATRAYYPSQGRRPRLGRLEINPPPNRLLPPPAPHFYRSWSIESAPNPATEYTPGYTQNEPIVVAPVIGRGGAHHPHQGDHHKPMP
jgi:hypothetical protein